jgi:hypothetical protein
MKEHGCKQKILYDKEGKATNFRPRKAPRARILKHSMESEKSTFQRSECASGLTVDTAFLLLLKTILCKQLRKTLKLAQMIYICILYLKYLETYLETLH